MQQIGSFHSSTMGAVFVMRTTYKSADGPTAIILEGPGGEPLSTLSVNMYRPECSRDSRDLPKDCFYVKTWGGSHDLLAQDALASGLFKVRDDLPPALSGFVSAPVWEIVA